VVFIRPFVPPLITSPIRGFLQSERPNGSSTVCQPNEYKDFFPPGPRRPVRQSGHVEQQKPQMWACHSDFTSWNHSEFQPSAFRLSPSRLSHREFLLFKTPLFLQNQHETNTFPIPPPGVVPVRKDLRKQPIQKNLPKQCPSGRTQNHIISNTDPPGGVVLTLTPALGLSASGFRGQTSISVTILAQFFVTVLSQFSGPRPGGGCKGGK
jgi:hypothetical protein